MHADSVPPLFVASRLWVLEALWGFGRWGLLKLRRRALGQVTPAQLAQDQWVLETLGRPTGGFFVELGAHDGVELSNTLLLERSYGWKGICIEPAPDAFRELERNRRCAVSPECVYSQAGEERSFTIFPGRSVNSGLSHGLAHRWVARIWPPTEVKVRTVTLAEVLKRHAAPPVIDFLSLDTEGSELEILRSFPFHEYRFRAICVEHNFQEPRRRELHELLHRHGYRRVDRFLWDDFYVHEEVRGED